LRKSRDELAPAFQSIQGFANASAKERGLKGGDASVNDEDALRAIQKGIKQVSDTLSQLNTSEGQETDLYKRSTRELAELEALLPAMASDAEVEAEAKAAQSKLDPNLTGMKRMGPTMAYLQEKFGTSLDKARASGIVKQLLTA
jgi:uncharacterized protein